MLESHGRVLGSRGVPLASHPVDEEAERAGHKVALQVHPLLGPNLLKQYHQLGTKDWMSQPVATCTLNCSMPC